MDLNNREMKNYSAFLVRRRLTLIHLLGKQVGLATHLCALVTKAQMLLAICTNKRRVALAPAQLVCSGVQLLSGRASAPPGGSFTTQGIRWSVERQKMSNFLIGCCLENK